jgi:hypothetical protein
MKSKALNRPEESWQAEMDAETLARAEEIRADKARLTKASKAAKKMVADAKTKATAMAKVARKGKTNARKNKKG